MKKILLLLIITFLVPCVADAQNDDWKEFIKERKQEKKEYCDKLAKENAAFVDYLNKAWEEFKINRGKKDPLGVLPSDPTFYIAPEGRASKNNAKLKSHGIPMGEFSDFINNELDTDIYSEYDKTADVVHLHFYGIHRDIPFSPSMKLRPVKHLESNVSAAWKNLSSSDFINTVTSLEELRNESNLSDWATYSLVKNYVNAVYSKEQVNEKVVTQVFLLSQMKYKLKMAYSSDEHLLMLVPFKENVYQVPFISVEDKDYAIYSYDRISSMTSVYTYANDFITSNPIFSLKINKPIDFSEESKYIDVKLPLWSEIMGRDISVPVDNSLISFSYNYPHSELSVYHKSAVDDKTAEVIIKEVKYQLLKEQYNKQESLSFILNLIQNGFAYKTDYEMFGRAKPLFIEESIYYGSNNCKDRVLLLSWLIKKVLNLNSILLAYPEHLSCAVDITDFPDLEGDSINYGGKKYLVCDPTYIGAPIGETMPRYRGVEPKILAFNNK